MSWFSSSKAPTPQRATIREQEIGMLQRTTRDLTWTTPDRTCVKEIRAGHLIFRLEMTIVDNFPQAPPVLRLLTPASHPWVDAQGYLTRCPTIANWNPQSPSLISLLTFVENKFRETPPTALTTAQQQHQQQQPQQRPPNGQPQYGGYNPYPANPTQSAHYQAPPPYGIPPPGAAPIQYQQPQSSQQNMPYQPQPPPSQQQQQQPQPSYLPQNNSNSYGPPPQYNHQMSINPP
eukprot:UN02557